MKISVEHVVGEQSGEFLLTLGDPDKEHCIVKRFFYGVDGMQAWRARDLADAYLDGARDALQAFGNQHPPRIDGHGGAHVELFRLCDEEAKPAERQWCMSGEG